MPSSASVALDSDFHHPSQRLAALFRRQWPTLYVGAEGRLWPTQQPAGLTHETCSFRRPGYGTRVLAVVLVTALFLLLQPLRVLALPLKSDPL